MLLDPETLDLLPRAAEVVEAGRRPALQARDAGRAARAQPAAGAQRAGGDRRRSLPRGATSPRAAAPVGRLAAAGVHPFAAPIGELNPGERYALTEGEYGDDRPPPARLRAPGPRRGRRRRPLARGLQRPAAVAAAASPRSPPTRRSTTGRDTGMASIRPKIGEHAPAPGDPARDRARGRRSRRRSRWGAASGAVPEPRRWWWELRPHPAFGTLEVRVPDAQATVEDAAAVAALVHALVGWLAARHDAGEPLDDGRHLAARGEPLVGGPLGHGRRARRPARPGERDAGARAAWRALRRRARAGRRAARLRRGAGRPSSGSPRANGAVAPARGRAGGGGARAAWPLARPTRYVPDAGLRSGGTAGTPERPMTRCPRRPRRAATRRRCSAALREPPHHAAADRRCPTAPDPLADEDLQLALYCCYELHYRGLPGVDERWEWSPSLLALRQRARGSASRRALRDAVGPGRRRRRRPRRWTSRCARSRTPTTRRRSRATSSATRRSTQVLEFLVHRSAYQLKEADPHSWAIPRLSGRAQGGAGGDPGRRVRRRPARAHARAAVRRRDGRARASTPATAPTSTACRRRRSRPST